jgi:arylsulfatase A-like enzyme
MRNIPGLLFIAILIWVQSLGLAATPPRPNVILIMTDDQGWGDFGFHGNPHLKTPHLDRLASQSIELTQFYVSPVCSPTRASLLTSRYNYRTGAIDTYLGRSTMAADETTLAELLSMGGYRTGIFGKWHLGDSYPSRAMDQGFAQSLVHRGGGVGQPSDPPGNSYFDPTLTLNGRAIKSHGYCSDVFTDAAIQFIETNRDVPFFAYLAFNCPHTPLQVPNEYHNRYKELSLDDDTAKLYGMVANIDDNIGRLLAKVEELKLADSTIVVFLTDNGPQVRRYNGILNGLKGSVHDGGIHVPCLLRWPGKFQAGSKIDAVSAHIDMVPTLLAACRVAAPVDLKLDGVNLLPVLLREQAALPERLLYFQWHRGDRPQIFRACAVRGPRYKLLQPEGRGDARQFDEAWALYDMANDPGEQHNVIESHRQLADDMKAAYQAWFSDVSATRGFPAPRIVVGTRHENPVTLTRQDWRGPQAGWDNNGLGFWDVEVPQAADYDITVRTPAQQTARTLHLRIGPVEKTQPLAANADRVTFGSVRLEPGIRRVETIVEHGQSRAGAHYVDLFARDVPSEDQ